jgi:hypothetical protein
MRNKYIIEVRDEAGNLDFAKEREVRNQHPFLFSKQEFTFDKLLWWASFGEGRNAPIGPVDLPEFMKSLGVTYRVKTW